MRSKPEARKPKPERNPKAEIRSHADRLVRVRSRLVAGIGAEPPAGLMPHSRPSDFGFLSAFGLRASDLDRAVKVQEPLPRHADPRAQRLDLTAGAVGVARGAAAAPMPDQPVAEHRPLLLRHQLHQFLLDLLGRGLLRQAEPLRQAGDVRIHDHAAVHVKRVAQHDVGCLAAHAAQLRQLLHRARHLAAVLLHQRLAAGLEALGLVAEEPGRLDGPLQSGQGSPGVVGGGAILLEQVRRDQVHALVGALRREDGRHQQFERVGVVQFAMRVRVSLLQAGDDLLQPGSLRFF